MNEGGEEPQLDQEDGHRADAQAWIRLPSPAPRFLSPRGNLRKKLAAWELVLHSQDIPYRVTRSRRTHELWVHVDDYERAHHELSSYEHENLNWPPPPPEPKPFRGVYPTLLGLLLLALFHTLTLEQVTLLAHSPVEWLELGAAHSYKIIDGQWWRLITALTLHSGQEHLLGNVVIGGLFVLFVCAELGGGLGWFAVLFSGIFGNLANALMRESLHLSVGASTSSFGAVGILVGLRLTEVEGFGRWRRWLLPLAGGAGLLAMLGTSGERTDLGAHYLGLVAGIVIGCAIGLYKRFSAAAPLRPFSSIALGFAALLIPCCAWLAALTITA